jgi:hypothetical protein
MSMFTGKGPAVEVVKNQVVAAAVTDQPHSILKKKYLIFPLFAAFSSFGQKTDSGYVKKKLVKTNVQALLSYYTQNGHHSAVTGGEGTEKLQVYASAINIKRQVDSLRTLEYDVGVDIISSASTDNIDFIVSSASRVDTRFHIRVGYDHLSKRSAFTLGGSLSASVESDYLSFGPGFSVHHKNKSQSRELSMELQTYFDDLRWGWYSEFKPVKLIYPQELRFKEWYKSNKRNSYNLSFGIYQTINSRIALGIYPGISYQRGLLATPFHRVYFKDSSLKVENLPESRFKVPLGFQLNTFLTDKWIIRLYYRFYHDDHHITAHTVNLETPFKITPFFTLSPFFRFYIQNESKYFGPYRQHDILEKFYSSDYDLSAFRSYNPGLSLRMAARRQRLFDEFELRYSFYKRSDELAAHIISILFDFTHEKFRIKKLIGYQP